jgi:peptide/nickel transport system ATP-binding protein
VLFDQPQHPYTVGLLGSIPRLDVQRERLASIEGQVPSPLRRAPGCSFAERCPFAIAQCRAEEPPLAEVGASHRSACWRAPLDPDALVPHPPRRRPSHDHDRAAAAGPGPGEALPGAPRAASAA